MLPTLTALAMNPASRTDPIGSLQSQECFLGASPGRGKQKNNNKGIKKHNALNNGLISVFNHCLFPFHLTPGFSTL